MTTASEELMKRKKDHNSLNSYAVKSNCGKTCVELGFICFSNFQKTLNNLNITGISELCLAITQAETKLSPKEMKMFKKYLIFLMKKSSLKEAFITKTFSSALKNGVSFDTNIAGNITHAAMVAVRRGWEFPGKLRAWFEFTKAGVDPNFAFILSFFCIDEKGEGIFFKSNGYSSNHELFGFPSLNEGIYSLSLPPKEIHPPLSKDVSKGFKIFETMNAYTEIPYDFLKIKPSSIISCKVEKDEYGDVLYIVDVGKTAQLINSFLKGDEDA